MRGNLSKVISMVTLSVLLVDSTERDCLTFMSYKSNVRAKVTRPTLENEE